MEDYVRQALEIVKAQAGFRSMTEDELASMIKSLSEAIRDLVPVAESSPAGMEKAPTDKYVICLECGKAFKIITQKHLRSHGLTPDEYKDKWGYPRDLPLICKNLQKERRKKMRNMKLWERRRKEPAAE